MAVSVSNVDLMERVCHLTNKIYREMLCITSRERITYLTIRGLDQVPVGAFSWTPEYRIVLSMGLLAWIAVEGRIPCTFTNFIANPEISGPFYISLDIYHTQITEYSLEKFYKLSSFLSASNIFLIVIYLDPPPIVFTVTIAFSIRTGLLGITFPVLFQLE